MSEAARNEAAASGNIYCRYRVIYATFTLVLIYVGNGMVFMYVSMIFFMSLHYFHLVPGLCQFSITHMVVLGHI